MAAIDTLIQIKQGNSVGLRESKDLEIWLKTIGLGASNIQVAEIVVGTIDIAGKLSVQAGAAAGEVINKGQLDAATGSLDGDVSALDGRLTTAESDIGTLDGRVTATEGDITALDGRLTTAESDINTLQADLLTIESNNPDEEEFTAIAAQVLFNLTLFTVDADNLVRDIVVFVDGRRQLQATSGVFSGNKGWRKNSTSQIELAEAPGEGKVVII